MNNTVRDLIDAFRATPDCLVGLLRGYSEAEMRAASGGNENWSVIQVLCHLRDAEERGLERMRKMRDQQNPFLAAYDQEAWAIERNYAATPMAEALGDFIRFRSLHLAELQALQPADWERTGRHEEQGDITISGQTLHLVSHDAIHLAQIARQLRDSARTP